MPADLPPGAEAQAFAEHFADGRAPAPRARALAIEAPVAVEVNGLGYAVMMATPTDLEDYALGFCLAEQLIAGPGGFVSAQAAEIDGRGWILRITLAVADAAPLMERARLRLSEGSCGLCGIESLEQVLRPLPQVTPGLTVDQAAIFRATAALADYQVLGRATRAVHAAAFCRTDGSIVLLREDVGRHNAFDKLVGGLARAGIDPASGFVVLTARCSFELVQKAVIARVPLLVTVSAASTLAAERAKAHGLRLVSLARDDSFLES
jgi:FdhD protein